MSYKCYLFGELMPETPGKLTLKIKGANKTITLLNEGEINILKMPGLTEINLSLTLPMFTAEKTPDYYLSLFEKAKTERTATQFIMTRTSPAGRLLFDTNVKVSVEDYSIEENAANGLDVVVTVKLKQYRDYGTKTLTLVDEKASGAADAAETANSTDVATSVAVTDERPAETAPKANTYTVKKGDTLWAIAKKYYGDGAQYARIYEANKSEIANPNLIYVGQVLNLPQ